MLLSLSVSVCPSVTVSSQLIISHFIHLHNFNTSSFVLLPHATSDCPRLQVCQLSYSVHVTNFFYVPVCMLRMNGFLRATAYMLQLVYAIARPSVRSSLRLSVCLSDGWIIEKRLKLGL